MPGNLLRNAIERIRPKNIEKYLLTLHLFRKQKWRTTSTRPVPDISETGLDLRSAVSKSCPYAKRSSRVVIPPLAAEDDRSAYSDTKNPAGVELENSRFFTSLGKTFEERNAELRILIEQREDWKMLINKALQLALRDIRNYEYGEVNGVPQWIKNKRQKKDGELRSDGDRDLNNN
ncbi:hypothetical protein Q1695_007419 [Nippostrongylus brasiliensis]|nr:hypothetical protein Q1695_007419 [Nippostrongylus brasiliensis]